MALPLSPEDIFEELFVDLHASKLWEDGKMLSDVIPLFESKEILFQYRVEKRKNDFDLKSFFEKKSKNYEKEPDTAFFWSVMFTVCHFDSRCMRLVFLKRSFFRCQV